MQITFFNAHSYIVSPTPLGADSRTITDPGVVQSINEKQGQMAQSVQIDQSVRTRHWMEQWLQDTKLSVFDQDKMQRVFRAPGSEYPLLQPRPRELRCFDTKPELRRILALWGDRLYHAMFEKLEEKIVTQTTNDSQKRARLNAFQSAGQEAWLCSVVYSDGKPSTQMSPHQPDEDFSMWWPCLAVFWKGKWYVYCQQQALNGGHPWETHPSRIFVLRQREPAASPPDENNGARGSEDPQAPNDAPDWELVD